jgi:hypothetical protein
LDGHVLSRARDDLILVCIHRQNLVRLRELFGKFPKKSPHILRKKVMKSPTKMLEDFCRFLARREMSGSLWKAMNQTWTYTSWIFKKNHRWRLMNFISSKDFMNLHGWTCIPLG